MRFIVGVMTGLVVGAAGAVFYSVQTGRDLRDEFRHVRADLQQRDFEALSTLLESRFRELQASLERREAGATGSPGDGSGSGDAFAPAPAGSAAGDLSAT